MIFPLQSLYHFDFLSRQYPSYDLIYSKLLCYGGGSPLFITCEHQNFHLHLFQSFNRFESVFLYLVCHCYDSCQLSIHEENHGCLAICLKGLEFPGYLIGHSKPEALRKPYVPEKNLPSRISGPDPPSWQVFEGVGIWHELTLNR